MKKPVKVSSSATRVAKPVAKPVPSAQRAPAAIVRPTFLEVLHVALTRTSEASAQFGDRLIELGSSREIAQSDLEATQLFGRVADTAEAPVKSFKSLVTQFRLEAEKAAGPDTKDPVRLNVGSGPRVLTFQDNRKVTLSWKDETMKLARLLFSVADAYAKGDVVSLKTMLAPFAGAFDEKLFEEALKRGKEKTGNLTPQIVEGS